MATAPVPVPLNTPNGSGLRLYRESGRQQPMYYDQAKTQGPTYYAVSGRDQLWADVGTARLRIIPPTGLATTITVQIGVGTTPAPTTGEYITPEQLDQALAALSTDLVSRYADVGGSETVSGQWKFSTAPLGPDDKPLGGAGQTAAQVQSLVDKAVAAQLQALDARYAQTSSDETIAGVWNYTQSPLLNGTPISAGSDSRLLDQATAAAAAAQRSADTANAALVQVQAYIAGGGGGGTAPVSKKAQVSSIRLLVQDDGSGTLPVVSGRFLGDPGDGKAYVGANNGQIAIADFDTAIYPTGTVKHASIVREYAGDALLYPASVRSDARTWALAGRVPFLSHKLGPYTMAQVASGAADADIDNNATWAAGLKTSTNTPAPQFWCFYHEPEDDSAVRNQFSAGDYRTAYRRIIARTRAIAPNVSWFSPCLQGFAFRSTAKWDWKSFHPNWNGSAWAYDVLDGDAIDLYNPNVNPQAGDRNQTWTNSAGGAFVRARVAAGAKQLPWLIGEYGFKNDVASLDDGGVTVSTILTGTMDVGVATQRLIGWCVWNNDSSRKTATFDTDGTQRAAIKAAMNHTRAVTV